MSNQFSRGSEWRKWDLHVHTPLSIYQNFGGDTEEVWKKYIKELESLPGEFAVIGVNDYLFIDGYKRLKLEQESNNRLKNLKLFPVVEFRIEKFAGIDFKKLKRINFHVIFSDDLPIETIESQFLNTLQQSYYIEGGEPWSRAITRESVKELGKRIKESIPPEELGKYGDDLTEGFNNLNLKEDQIFESLNKDCFKGKFLTAIGKTEWADLKWNEGSISTKKDIINKVNIVFTAANSVEEFKKAKAQLIKQRVNHILLDCSDAHGFSSHTDKDKIGNCFTWIKSDPTFEGLKQILYEPEERIRVQESNPVNDFDKPLFTSIQITQETKVLEDENSELEFLEGSISLNQNLVSIIGGRGQGKSMLINYLGYGFNKEISIKLQDKILLNEDFMVEWKQGNEVEVKTYSFNEQKNLPFTFIYQSKIKEIADDAETLKKEIIEILSGAGFQRPMNKLDDIIVKEALQNYWNILEWLNEKDDKGKNINDKEQIHKRIEDLKSLINLATEGSNKSNLEEYVLNVDAINSKREDNDSLRQLRMQIINARERLNIEISFFPEISQIDTTIQQTQIRNLYHTNLKTIKRYIAANERIKTNNFHNFKGDLVELLSNLTNYQNEIKELEKHIKLIDDKSTDLENARKRLNEIIIEQLKLLEEEAKAITNTWKNRIFDNPERGASENELIKKILADKNINIEGTIFFNTSAFYNASERLIDGRVLRPKSKEKVFDLLKLNKEFIANDVLKYTIEKLEEIKSTNNCFFEGIENDIFKIFIDPIIKNKYVQVIADITVDGKNLNELSAGQKGTVYLCLKLATQLFTGPIIFDQPEDDLDNDFITNHLIDLFKEIKKYRQVIIVSHNANIVVNADSEQIIIASNNDEKLSYTSGSLENQYINKEICRILEGGERAFEKRRDKYHYLKT